MRPIYDPTPPPFGQFTRRRTQLSDPHRDDHARRLWTLRAQGRVAATLIGPGRWPRAQMLEHFPDHYDGPSKALVKWLEHVPRAEKVLRWYPQRWRESGFGVLWPVPNHPCRSRSRGAELRG